MKLRKPIFTLFLPLLPGLLCTGCPAAGTAPEAVASAADRPATTDDRPVTDSIVCGESCTEYTCYFTGDRLDKEALRNIRTLIFDGFAWYTDFQKHPDANSADLARRQALDSLSSLAWLRTEPWPEVRDLFLAWSEQQLERNYIVYRSRRDPYFLYECSETDPTIERCADLLTRQEEGRVGRIPAVSQSERAGEGCPRQRGLRQNLPRLYVAPYRRGAGATRQPAPGRRPCVSNDQQPYQPQNPRSAERGRNGRFHPIHRRFSRVVR